MTPMLRYNALLLEFIIEEVSDGFDMSMTLVTNNSVKYNIRWGNRSHQSSIINASNLMATYKKKVRAVLWKNKNLARALVASKMMIRELEKSNSCQQKVFNLALPKVKALLEMAMQHSRTMYEYQSRAVTLLDELMNPGVDFTLVRVSDADDDADIQDQRPSLHPPGKRSEDQSGEFSVIPEEDEDASASRRMLLDTFTQDSETLLRAAGVTPRKSLGARSSGRISILDGPPSSSTKPPAPVLDDSVQSFGCKVRGPRRTDIGTGYLDYDFLESPNPTALLRQGNEPGEKMVTGGAHSRIPEVADSQHLKTASEKHATSASSAVNNQDLENAPRVSFLPNKRKEATDAQELLGLKRADTPVASGAEAAYGVDQRRHPPRPPCRISSPSPGECEDTTALGFEEMIWRNIRRGRKIGAAPRDFDLSSNDLSSLESPSLTAADPVFPELSSPQKHSEKAPRLSIPPNKEKEPTNRPDLDSLGPADSSVANGAEASCGIDQRSPQQISSHAFRSSPEHAEDSTGLLDNADDRKKSSSGSTLSLWETDHGQGLSTSDFLRLIRTNITCRKKTGITPLDFDLSFLESPSPAAAVPQISDLACAPMVTRASGQEKSSREVGTASQKAPDEPPMSASSTDAEKESHASFARSKENEPAAVTGLGGMEHSTNPAATTEPVPSVDRGKPRSKKRQGTKTSRRRRASREPSEDGTSSVASSAADRERVERSASGRPMRSAAIGKNYKEPDIGKKLRRP
ncbi:uncharacterized protein LOC144124218 [Amblyomma americanum]